MSESTNQLVCYIHPKRETQLRCNRCDQPICIKCATHTPTGYRCPECIRSQQRVFVTTKWFDQIIAALITGVIAYVGSLFDFLGFYSLLIAIGAGFTAVWVVKKAIQNRRSPYLKYVMSGAALIAGLIRTGLVLYPLLVIDGLVVNFYSVVWKIAYAVLIAGSIYYRLKN